MAELDPVEAGLRKTEAELEAYAAELAASVSLAPGPSQVTPATSERVDDPIGRAAAELVGGILRIGVARLFERPPRPPTKPRSHLTSPAQAAVAVLPLPPVTAAPAPAESQPAPALPVESGKPEMSSGATLGLPGLSFVGYVADRPEARNSNRFPAEHMEAHTQRLDISRSEMIPRAKMRGPVIGSRE